MTHRFQNQADWYTKKHAPGKERQQGVVLQADRMIPTTGLAEEAVVAAVETKTKTVI